MTSMENKLMGYKPQNYISSSESEGEDSDACGSNNIKESVASTEPATSTTAGSLRTSRGSKTGPKGVIEDFRRYKQLEMEQKRDQDKELQKLAKEFSLSCQSNLDEEKEKSMLKELEEEEDAFLQQYHLRRLLQMKEEQEKRLSISRPRFGKLLRITANQFLEAVDEEKPNVNIVIHLYDEGLQSCRAMNDCLSTLAQQFTTVKFCKVVASDTGISKHFRERGLPALLVYRDGQLIGNFVRLQDTLGEDFYASDVESFLIENGIVSVVEHVCGKQNPRKEAASDTDSDLDLD